MMNFQNYMLFYEHLYDYPGSTNNLIDTLGKNLKFIAADLDLVKMDIEINLPPIFCERFPYTFKQTIFDTKEEVNIIPVSTEFSTSNDGLITITAFSSKTVNWSREQKSEIIFLNEQIMVLINRSRLQSQIKKAEETDSLTSVLNLSGIMHVGELLTIKKMLPNFSVMNLTINNFADYDKKYGHLAADEILKSYALALSDFIGKDGVIGRICTSNFTIVVSNKKVQEVIDFLADFTLRIELDVETKEQIAYSTTIGICAGNKADYFPQLFVNANQALKQAGEQNIKVVTF